MQHLEITDLCKTYKNGVKALDNVSLTISSGMFGLLGPNGAGKSSLMRTLATLQQPDSGQISFDGINVLQHPEQLRMQLGYLPQDFGVYPRVSALDLLDHMAVLKGVLNKKQRKEQVAALLQQTNLYTERKRAVSSFSGGMRQRFGIAQALLGDPKLIIVDEPTAGLDPLERNRFHDLLSEIGENIVVLLSTHIVEDVHDLCSEMAILAGGKVILKGKPASLTQQLDGMIWKKIVPKSALPVYQQTLDVISTRLTGGQITVHAISPTQPAEGFESFYPELEDVYFSALFGKQPEVKGGVIC
ncbi:ABC transporter ATP-binding protein [Terrimonas sp. NA20]|uniref:ABC transporter ATP-binding protein n=1 Tax=Terrimonas ginsenosidimutans TaxID=2908004 RepID=A0ABS9KXG3_9BACT|nr:ABC transporter ATP-binding protein [Terrimonas ginsenosidimutans]MCG2617006.1 ABC transporter ATP-binding protein [Terrimonas ginsenosidimutans]